MKQRTPNRILTIALVLTTLLILAVLPLASTASVLPPEHARVAEPAYSTTADAHNVELVGQIGGATYAVAVQGNYAYLGVGPRLVVLDVSDPANPTAVGQTAVLPDAVHGVYVVGDYAYVADLSSGLRMIDVSNPAAPVELGAYDTPGSAQDVYVAGSYAYVAYGDAGLRVVDVSNPATPVEVGAYSTAGHARGVYVTGGYAYVAASTNLRVVDVSNPAAPVEVGVYSMPGGDAFGVYVAGSYAYVAAYAAGLRVIDVSNPAAPVEVGAHDTPCCAYNVYVGGDYAYVAEGNGLWVIDVSNPTAPMEVSTYDTPARAQDVHVVGSYAYVAAGDSGLRVISVSNPAVLVEVSAYTVPWEAWGVHVTGNYAYVAAGSSGLRIADVSNPAAPVEVGAYDTPGYAWDVHVAGNYAYVADRWAGLRVVDVSNSTAPVEVGSYGAPSEAWDVYVAGNYAYVVLASSLQVIDVSNPTTPLQVGSTSVSAESVYVIGNYAYTVGPSGLWIFDVSNPADPVAVGPYHAQWSGYDLHVAGRYAYVAALGAGLRVVDVSNSAAPVEVGFYDTPGYAWDVYVAGGYAYVGDEGGSLRVVDVSNPATPHEVGSYDTTPGKPYGVYIANGYAYVANVWGGLLILRFPGAVGPTPGYIELIGQVGGATLAVAVQGDYAYLGVGPRLVVLDVSDPANPTMTGQSPVFPGIVEGVYVTGGYAYVAAGSSGLRVVDVSNPAAPVEVGFYDTPGHAEDVYVAGAFAYVADQGSGLRVVNASNPAAPVEVGFHDTLGSAHAVYVVGDYAYVADDWTGLRVISVADPTHPAEIGFYDMPGEDRDVDVYVVGTLAYVAEIDEPFNGSLRVISVADPVHPVELGSIGLSDRVSAIHVVGDYAYAAKSLGLSVVSVADPYHPTLMGYYPTQGDPWAVYVIGDHAYVAEGGLRVVSVSDPTHPVGVGFYHASGSIRSVYVADAYAYMADWRGLGIVSVFDPAHPVEVAFHETWPDEPQDVYVQGDYAYVASYDDVWTDVGLEVVSVSDPTNPTRMGYYESGGNKTESVHVSGDYAYVAERGGLRIISVADPAHPTEVSFYEIPSAAMDVYVVGEYAYVASQWAGLWVISVSDPAHPVEVGFYDTPGLALAVYIVGQYAYVADEGAGLRVISVSDPTQPTEVGYCDTPVSDHDVAVTGGYAYVTGGHGLRVVDVSDPAAPVEVGTYVPPDWPFGVYVASGYAYVADGAGGLFILRFTGGRPPAPPPFGPDVRVNDDTGPAYQSFPAIAVDAGGNAYAVWHDERNGDPDIYFSKRDAATGLWSPNVRVNDDTGSAGQGFPDIAVDALGNAYAVWEDNRNGDPDIYFAELPSSSSTWSTNVRVNDPSTAGQNTPAIAVDSMGNAYAVWQDHRSDPTGSGDIFYAKLPAGSNTWSTDDQVHESIGASTPDERNPDVTVDELGNVHVIWETPFGVFDSKIEYARLPVGSSTWEISGRVDTEGDATKPKIAADEAGNVHVIWVDGWGTGSVNVYHASLAAGSDTWSASTRVNDTFPGRVSGSIAGPSITVDDLGNTYAVWAEVRNRLEDIYSAQLPVGSTTWGTNVRVNDDDLGLNHQAVPDIAVDATGNLYVVWQDGSNLHPETGADIYFAWTGGPGPTLPPVPQDPLTLSASSTYATTEHVVVRTSVYNSSSASKSFNVTVSLLKDGATEASLTQTPTVAGYGTASLTFDFGTRAAGSYQIKAELFDGPTLLKTKWANFTVLDSTGIRLAGEHAEELKGAVESEFDQMATIPARALADEAIRFGLDALQDYAVGKFAAFAAPIQDAAGIPRSSSDSAVSQIRDKLGILRLKRQNIAAAVRLQVRNTYGIELPNDFDPLNDPLENISDVTVREGVKNILLDTATDFLKSPIKWLWTEPQMANVELRHTEFMETMTSTFPWSSDIEQIFDRGKDRIKNIVESDAIVSVGPYNVLGHTVKYDVTLQEQENKRHDLRQAGRWLKIALALLTVVAVVIILLLFIGAIASTGFIATVIAPLVWHFVKLLLSVSKVIKLATAFLAVSMLFTVPAIAPHVTTEHDNTLDAVESTIGSQGQALGLIDFSVTSVQKDQPVKLSVRVESSEVRRTANPVVETTIYSIDGRVVRIIWANPTIQPHQTALLEKVITLHPGQYKAVTTIHTGDQIAIASQAQTFQVAEPKLQLSVSLNKTQFTLGEAVRTSITVTNTDVISDVNDLTLIAESSDGRNFDAWPVSLAAGESKEIEYSFIPPQEGSYVLRASLSIGLNVLASQDVSYLVGSGPALALNFSAQEVYDPGLDVTVPVTVTNVGDQTSAITLTVTTLDRLHDLTQVFSQTHDLNVGAGSSTTLSATVLPGAQPRLYTTRLALGGEIYNSLDFAIAAQDTLFADIYPDAVIHQVGDTVQLNVQVLNSVYTYTAATTDVVLTEPTGVTQTIVMSGADGQYQGSYPANITGTYPVEVSVSKPDYRAVSNTSFFIAGERSVLLPTVTGQPAVGQTAPLTVTVENELGATIPEATVELTRTNESYLLSTNQDGQAILLLSPDDDESYHLTVSKMGFMGTAMEVPVAVISDTVPPFIIFDAPAEGQFVNTTPLTITGMTEVSSTLTLNAQPVVVDGQGLFTVTVDLSEGNNLVTAMAIDPASNSTTVTRTVNLDTAPTALAVTSPTDRLFTTTDVITVTGSAEVGASLTVSGTLSTIQPDGSFTAWVLLSLGENAIPVVAMDAASNSTTITRTVGYSPLFGDVDFDCSVGVTDIMAVSSVWRVKAGESGYEPFYDVDGDDDIDVVDVMLVAARWGERCGRS